MLEKQLLAWAIILMAVNTIANVCARLGFSSSLFFFRGAQSVPDRAGDLRRHQRGGTPGRHIRMSALTDLLGIAHRRRMFAVMQVITAVVVAVLGWYAMQYILRIQGLGRVTPALQMPMWITLLWLPLGLGLTAIQFLLAAVANIRGEDVYLAHSVRETDEVDMPSI